MIVVTGMSDASDRHTVAFAFFLVAALSSCSTPDTDVPAAVRDSAGIAIVESLAPAWSTVDAWRLSQDPLVSIGVEDGPPEYQLFRVLSAVRVEDDRIVIANGGTSELRFYDAAGRFLFSRGGDGEGPGEFRSLGRIWRLADSLFLWDWSLSRVSVYSTSGEFARSFRVHPTADGALPFGQGLFSNRYLLVWRTPRDQELAVGLARDTSLYLRYTLDGEQADTVGRFAGSEDYIGKQGELTFSTSAPFGREATVIASGERLYFGSSDRYEIEIRTSDGRLERLIRRPIPNPPVTDEERETFHASQRERLQRASSLWRGLYEMMSLPATKPAYGRMLVDAVGNMWVSEYVERQSGLSPDARLWTVFDPQGRLLGTVEMPASWLVLEIGDDYVLGVWRDDLDVERVRLYELIKP